MKLPTLWLPTFSLVPSLPPSQWRKTHITPHKFWKMKKHMIIEVPNATDQLFLFVYEHFKFLHQWDKISLSHIFWMELVWDVGTYPVLSTDRDREIQKWMTRSLNTRQMNVEANNFKGTKDFGGMWQRTTFPEDRLRVKLVGGLGFLARRIFWRKRCLL